MTAGSVEDAAERRDPFAPSEEDELAVGGFEHGLHAERAALVRVRVVVVGSPVGSERGEARGGHAVGVGADVILVARHAHPDRHRGSVRSLVHLEGREAKLECVPHLWALAELRLPREVDLAVAGMRDAIERGAELDRDVLLADAEARAAGGDLRGGENNAIVDLTAHRGLVLIDSCPLAGHGVAGHGDFARC